MNTVAVIGLGKFGYYIAKSLSRLELGVTKVVHPEKVAGRVLLHNLIENMSVEKIDLSNSMRIIKFRVTNAITGISLHEIALLESEIKIIALKRDEEWSIEIDTAYVTKKGDTLACLGNSKSVERFYNSIAK